MILNANIGVSNKQEWQGVLLWNCAHNTLLVIPTLTMRPIASIRSFATLLRRLVYLPCIWNHFHSIMRYTHGPPQNQLRWIRRVKPSGEVIEAGYKYAQSCPVTIVYPRRPTDSHTSACYPRWVTLFNWRSFSRTNLDKSVGVPYHKDTQRTDFQKSSLLVDIS